jgi:hypothetical protein
MNDIDYDEWRDKFQDDYGRRPSWQELDLYIQDHQAHAAEILSDHFKDKESGL